MGHGDGRLSDQNRKLSTKGMREGSGRFYRRPLLVGVKTLSSALSWSTERNPMTNSGVVLV